MSRRICHSVFRLFLFFFFFSGRSAWRENGPDICICYKYVSRKYSRSSSIDFFFSFFFFTFVLLISSLYPLAHSRNIKLYPMNHWTALNNYGPPSSRQSACVSLYHLSWRCQRDVGNGTTNFNVTVTRIIIGPTVSENAVGHTLRLGVVSSITWEN